MSRHLRYLVPLFLFIVIVAFLYIGLGGNPRAVPSPLVGRATPEFALPTVHAPNRVLRRNDVIGRVHMLNVWATWCASCRVEHPVLMNIAKSGDVPIYGVNYKDDRAAAIEWLGSFGDPYVASLYDADGRLGIDLGVIGAPETFVVDRNGLIVYKHTGPISEADWRTTIRPIVRELQDRPG